MTSFWTGLTKVEKAVAGIAATIVSVALIWNYMYSGYDHFATKAYADEQDTEVKKELKAVDAEIKKELYTYQEQQLVSDNRAEIWRAKREIKRLNRAKREPDQSVMDIVLIDEDIKDYEDLIECITDRKELCY